MLSVQYCSQTGRVSPWKRLVCGNPLSSDFGLTPFTYDSKTVTLDNIAETMKAQEWARVSSAIVYRGLMSFMRPSLGTNSLLSSQPQSALSVLRVFHVLLDKDGVPGV